jgi:hypothetical protein
VNVNFFSSVFSSLLALQALLVAAATNKSPNSQRIIVLQ